jgi:hypothetical protein
LQSGAAICVFTAYQLVRQLFKQGSSMPYSTSTTSTPVTLCVSILDACPQTGLGKSKNNALCRAGELERIKFGRRSAVTTDSLVAYLERCKARGNA